MDTRKTLDKPAEITDNALAVLRQRYFLKDAVDHPTEDVDEFFRRVAHGVVSVEAEKGWASPDETREFEDRAYEMLRGLRFLPNSPCLMNSGKPEGYAQLAACFVLPVEDSLRSIKQADYDAAIIHQSGGGTGFNFSKIRPRGDFVRGSGGVASGPVSFMSVIDYSCGEVKQGGTRRGANMGILNVDHPDILEFITCKNQDGKIANFNISVGVTDAFMNAVEAGEEYELINPRTGEVHVDPKTGEEKRLNARWLWNKLVESAWLNGEPGIIFLDRIKDTNPTPGVGVQDTTNPCGEQPLLPYEACVLGSIKLSAYVRGKHIDWEALGDDVHLSVRFLDDMVESSNFPIEAIEAIVKHGNRRVGLGIMGWADMLYMLGIAYDGEEAYKLAEEVMNFVNLQARNASEALAEKRGPFPNWEGSIWRQSGDAARRNATVTTIAPTGTIAMIADASGGVEPQFALVYWKNVMRDENNKATSLRYLNNIFEEYARDNGFYGEDLIEAIEANHGSVRIRTDTPQKARAALERIPEEARRTFITAHDVTPEAHIRMQAAFQKYTENAVSKTINFPNEAKPNDINEGYWLAYKLGCKGVTVYRDGSRAMQVMTTSAEKDDGAELEAASETHANGQHERAAQSNGHIEVAPRSQVAATPRPRPKTVSGTTTTVDTGCGDLFVTMNDDDDGHPFELFATLGKAGGCAAAQTEAIGRLISLALRSGVGVEQVHKQLRGITCHRPVGLGPNRILSCADAIARGISTKYLEEDGSYKPYVDLQGEGTYTNGGPANEGFETPAHAAQSRQSPRAKVTAVQGAMFQQEFVPVYESAQEQGACVSCGSSQMYFSEGCVKCVVCGHSQCS